MFMNSFSLRAVGNLANTPEIASKGDVTYTRLHLIGNELDEQMVLNAGLAIEERAGFTARPEKWW